jgi:hypothetical protein
MTLNESLMMRSEKSPQKLNLNLNRVYFTQKKNEKDSILTNDYENNYINNKEDFIEPYDPHNLSQRALSYLQSFRDDLSRTHDSRSQLMKNDSSLGNSLKK